MDPGSDRKSPMFGRIRGCKEVRSMSFGIGFGAGLGPKGPQTDPKLTPQDPDRTSDNLELQPHELHQQCFRAIELILYVTQYCFRAVNRPSGLDFGRAATRTKTEIDPPAGHFGAFLVAVRPQSGQEGRFTTRKHHCVTEGARSGSFDPPNTPRPW
jgi:hypothetical protein